MATRFPTLVRSIIYQQLAGKAAAAIHGRVNAALKGDVAPQRLLRLSDEACQEAGLSRAKRDALRDLAEHVVDGRVDLTKHGRLSDDAVIAELVSVRGIGPWTAQMYLMHTLGRGDVWPVLDYGVRNGWSLLHRRDEMISPKELAVAGASLAPYRSSVAWYCWQAADSFAPRK